MNIHQIYIGNKREEVLMFYKKQMNSFKKIPRIRYFLWTEDNIINLIKNHYDDRVLNAYDSLFSNAMKADLARACIVYIYGGWYADISITAIDSNFILNPNPNPSIFFYDLQEDFFLKEIGYRTAIQNGFFYSESNEEILKHIIDKIVSNVENKYYGTTPWDTTGPLAYGEVIEKQGKLENIGTFVYNEEYKRRVYLSTEGKIVAKYKDHNAHSKFYENYPHYSTLWENKKYFI
jgi:mannosyltransferase OCH1-like enzyme